MGMIRLGDVRYNAQTESFEARVDVERGGKTFRYPCHVPGPIDMDTRWVTAALTRHALNQSDSWPPDRPDIPDQ
jgi:hypothetical protein